MSTHPARGHYLYGRSSLAAVLVATGSHGGNGWKPYTWRDPSASPHRQALAGAILAQVGAEPDAWDSPPPVQRKLNSGLPYLMGCGTEAAYRRHLRHGEDACMECLDANRRGNLRRKRTRQQRDLREVS